MSFGKNEMNRFCCWSLLFLSGCTTPNWSVTHHYDEFTNSKICRVELGTEFTRGMKRSLLKAYATYNFYAENNNGQVRAGIRTEPFFPIYGDIQILVGGKLYTITSEDTPLDTAPTVPIDTRYIEETMGKEYAETIQGMSNNILKLNSPYRAYTGQKAFALLRDMSNTPSKIKFRVVGVNAAVSGKGSFFVGDDFKAALKKCRVNL